MILQSQGKVTAQTLAEELEVSIRTVHRDILALSMAGVPVYTQRGAAGGVALVERYRSDLTGLTKDEVRALFMMNVPTPLAELGLEQKLRGAMLKLSAALPAALRADEQGVRQRIYIDPSPWESQEHLAPPSYLKVVQEALWDSQVLEISRHFWLRPNLGPLLTIVHPFGLVAKAGKWYLVGRQEDHIAVIRLDRIISVRQTGESFQRPGDFDLAGFWKVHCQEERSNRPTYPVTAYVNQGLLPSLTWHLGEGVLVHQPEAAAPGSTGKTEVHLVFEYFEQALKALLALGGAIEVIEPVALRYSLKDYAEQIRSVYA
jgi:predicted DNA-binding transcriptional regulator YafY